MAAVAVIVVSLFFLDFCLSKWGLVTTVYKLPSEELDAKIVLLADIHGSRFGRENARLVRKIRKENPDVIAIAGDMLTYDENNEDAAIELISLLSDIAPVYVSYGNHEKRHPLGAELNGLFTEAGAKVLDFSYQDIEIHGTPVRIGGLYGYALPEKSRVCRDNESEFLKEFQAVDSYKLLLTHMPYSWALHGSLDSWDVDLVLSGHLHGGQIIIPLIGGLYAPDQGYFPGKVWGMSESEDGKSHLIVSRGLGSSVRWLPRFHNIPEIVVVETGEKAI